MSETLSLLNLSYTVYKTGITIEKLRIKRSAEKIILYAIRDAPALSRTVDHTCMRGPTRQLEYV